MTYDFNFIYNQHIPELYLDDLTPGGGHSVHAAPVLGVVGGVVGGPDHAARTAELSATCC